MFIVKIMDLSCTDGAMCAVNYKMIRRFRKKQGGIKKCLLLETLQHHLKDPGNLLQERKRFSY